MPARRRAAPSAFLTVQEGCDKFCTYCVVPYTRGAEISRPWGDIVDEAQAAGRRRRARDRAARPECECLGAKTGRGLADLIRALDRIDGLERIRYTTSHPTDMTDALIAAHGEVEKLMPYLHLPVQSGSDRILKAMNRSHSADSYLRDHSTGSARRGPTSRCRGDFIVGFPGETDADFEATLQHRRRGAATLRLIRSNIAPARALRRRRWRTRSQREVMDERLQRLQARIDRAPARLQPGERSAATRKVLIERKGRQPGQMIGKSPWLQSVHVETRRRGRRHASRSTLVSAGPQQPGRRASASRCAA